MSNMYEKVLTVISKKPDLRQEFEIQSLMPWFRKKSQLFSQLKTDYLKDIIRNCSISTFVKDDIIIKQGEIGDCFYIILGGKISIFIYNKDKDAEEEDKGLDEIGSKTPEGKLDRSKLGNFVTHLGSGVPFGEVALMSEDCIRTASIIAEERTDLLKVDRALYNRAVKDVLAREFEEKREFIKTNPLFSNWAPRYRKQLAMAMYKETFPYDCTLVRQGEQVTNMYFVISGELEIQIDPSHHQVQYPKIFSDALEDSERVFKRTEKIRPPTEVQYSVNLRKKDTSKNSKMCLLGRNESVGDFEILLDLPTYMQTAVCTEKTEVLVLEMKHYERLFVKRHPRTIESMRHILKVKLDTRMNLLKSKGDIPFLNLVRKRIENFNNPKTSTEKKVKDFTSSSVAEKEFLNHKGPLIDIYGPGSVFYMIRIREKQKQRALQGVVNKQNNNGHLHSARIPQTLVLAAQMAGGTRDCDALSEKSESVHSRIVSHRLANSRSASTRVARSYRQIQSSSASEKDTVVEFEQSKEDAEAEHRNSSDFEENVAESVRSPREPRQRTFVTFPDTKEDMALKSLEDRVREWLDKNNNTRGANQVAHLRRLQDLGSLPKPGNKIVIRRRARTMIQDSPRNSEEKTASNSSMNMNGKIDGKIDPYQVLIS